MRALMWAAALAVGVLALSGCGRRGPEPLNAFDGRVEDWTREILTDSPELASRAGVSPDMIGRFADRLDDRSALAVETRRSAALRRLAEVREFADDQLPPDDALTYAVLRAQFEAAAAGASHEYGDFSQLGGVHPYVLNPLDSAFVTLPDFLDRVHTINTFADAENYLARLRAVSGAIDQETQHARQDGAAGVSPPGFIIDNTLRELDDIIGVAPEAQTYVTSFKRKLDNLVSHAGDARAQAQATQRAQNMLGQAVAIVRDRIIPAHQRAAAYLRSIRASASDDAGVWRLPEGDAYYRDALKIETTTDLTPAQIHRIGLDRVRELTNELDVALRRLGLTEGTVGARLAQMTADPQYRYPDTEEGRAQLLNDIRARLARVMSQAPNWFGRLPRQRLEVRRVPLFAEASSSGAYYEPGSVDGHTAGVYFVNLRDLGEMTKIDVPTQDYHEGVPGHHFQISLAREQTELPLLRRLLSFNAFEEGWALYAESLADEEGLYDNDPVGRVGYLRWQLWRAARPVVDTGMHAMHWSRQQAIDYLAQVTGDAPGVIQTEVDRYVVWPGQACSYELGRREIAQLRDRARNELGPDFDLKAFHDTVLSNGAVPLGVLDQIVHDWIPVQQRAAARDRH